MANTQQRPDYDVILKVTGVLDKSPENRDEDFLHFPLIDRLIQVADLQVHGWKGLHILKSYRKH